jgi:vanadium chloroperoxidase
MIKAREADGAGISTGDTPGSDEFQHRQDPYHPDQGFLDPHWGRVKPFHVGPNQVKPEGPKQEGDKYLAAFEEVRMKGAAVGHTRTVDETVQGLFWAYDGARGIGTPPRLYNQCVRTIALKKYTKVDQNARLLALINLAMADAGIIAWHEKYHYNFWRPVIGIREAGPDYGPKSGGPNRPEPDPFWRPYASPASNRPGLANFTPNFPAYPSGHATFGTACFEVVRRFFGGENVEWTQVSDELDGRTLDPDGSVRSLHRRQLDLDKAIRENLESRIFLGVHWRFDGTRGQTIGLKIADKLAEDDVLGLSSLSAVS